MPAGQVLAPIIAAPSYGTFRAGEPVEVHEGTAAKMRQHYDARGMELNAARLRMATLPATAEVHCCSISQGGVAARYIA